MKTSFKFLQWQCSQLSFERWLNPHDYGRLACIIVAHVVETNSMQKVNSEARRSIA